MTTINRLQISVVVENDNAVVDITRQQGRGVKETETHFATVHNNDWIEVANEYEVPLGTQLLITKVIREAMKDSSE